MKNNPHIKLSIAIIFIISILSCKKDKPSDAPVIPTESTMFMDLSFMSNEKSANNSFSDSSNYRISNVIVKYWALIAGLNTVLPTLSFKAVIDNGEASYDEDSKSWNWVKDFITTADQQFEATLTGKVMGDSIAWVMNIQKIGENVPYKYFEGVSKTNSGWWKIYSRINNATYPVFQISYLKTSEKVSYIQYTNIIANNDNYGSYIAFGKMQNSIFDKYFKAKTINIGTENSVNNKECTIEWSSITHEGDIKWDGFQGCWDKTLKNITCQ